MFNESMLKKEIPSHEPKLKREGGSSFMREYGDRLGDFTFEKWKEACQNDPRFSELFESVMRYAKAYVNKLEEMKSLSKCLYSDDACTERYDELMRTQSDDKDSFIEYLMQLRDRMNESGSDINLSFIQGGSSTFFGQLAYHIVQFME